jgi:uncharacterized YccA/Bax inhibitor family protein
MAATRNPVFSRAGFDEVYVEGEAGTMTLAGTIRKAFTLLAIMSAAMLYVWFGMPPIGLSEGVIYSLFIMGFVVGVGMLLYTTSHPEVAHITGPIYATLQGLVLGALTLVINAQYPGLPLQAAVITIGILTVMLVAYRVGAIQATERFKTIVVSCTLGVFAFYCIAFVLQLFGITIPMLHEGGVIGIGFSLFVTVLAAFNLVLDFETIEEGVGRAPVQFEWMAAFGLVVTLIWLYTEVLRLMRKLR